MMLMKTKLLTALCLLFATTALWAQPNGTGTYYQKANGKKGRELKTAMFNIIKNPSVVHYDSLWYAYNISDLFHAIRYTPIRTERVQAIRKG